MFIQPLFTQESEDAAMLPVLSQHTPVHVLFAIDLILNFLFFFDSLMFSETFFNAGRVLDDG